MRFVDDPGGFVRGPAFVLDLSDASFSDFFTSEEGLDLYKMLDREIPLNHVLERKVRRAAETGSPFVRVRSIFPH